MSYRVKIDGVQIFGNNTSYDEWNDFVESQGIDIDGDDCYDGETIDIEGVFKTIDKITRRLMMERHQEIVNCKRGFDGEPIRELTDLSGFDSLDDKTPLLWFNEMVVRNSYIFMPYQVKEILKDKIKRSKSFYQDKQVDWYMCSYELKDGETIRLSAS